MFNPLDWKPPAADDHFIPGIHLADMTTREHLRCCPPDLLCVITRTHGLLAISIPKTMPNESVFLTPGPWVTAWGLDRSGFVLNVYDGKHLTTSITVDPNDLRWGKEKTI